MKFFLGLFLFVTLLWAEFPKVYAQLGDDIYRNLPFIENLKHLEEFKPLVNDIERYVIEATKVKEQGFLIENGDANTNKKLYLDNLRSLTKTNTYYVSLVVTAFQKSIKTKNNLLFIQTVNSNLLPKNFKPTILSYYNKNADAIEISGLLAAIIEDEREKEEAREARRAQAAATKPAPAINTNQSKMQRLQKADEAKKEALRKKLEEEEARKKAQIIERQKQELSR